MALMRICTSPASGGGGGGRSASSILRSATRVSARIDRVRRRERNERARGAPSRRLARHHKGNVLAAEAEGIGQRVAYFRVARLVRHDIEWDRRIRGLVVDGRIRRSH